MAAPGGRLARAARDPLFERFRAEFDSGPTPRVAVFVGSGASHSWLWFADLLERLGLFDVAFIDELDVLSGDLGEFDVLMVGGGDTYAIAESLGKSGAGEIDSFVRRGGMYFGSCAGAYLVLSGVDREPFASFELVDGEMLNVMPDPPEPRCLAHKYLAPYGEEWVFHPVYGEVVLGPGPASAGFSCFEGRGTLSSVLFGGPILRALNDEEVAAVFAGLSDRAAYPWPRDEAGGLLEGKPAVIYASRGLGTAVASGPHLEHPLFPRANALAAELVWKHWRKRLEGGLSGRPEQHTSEGCLSGRPKPGDGREIEMLLHDIKRQVSNARIVGFGLEKMPVTWRIGVKVWEPEKIRMFLDYAWRRLPYLEGKKDRITEAAQLELLADGYAGVTGLARSLKMKVESGEDSLEEAISLLTSLKELTAQFLSLYFGLKLEGTFTDIERIVHTVGK